MTTDHSPTASSQSNPSPAVTERKSLMMRSAKVVCQTGEYICVVRDVSELGTSLSFLHEAPRERRIILALANGQTFPIERVWAGKHQAGYRFASAVEPDEFMKSDAPFAARPMRLSIRSNALITDGRENLPAQILDLGSHGVCVESLGDWGQNRLLRLRVNGLPQRLAQVAWRKRGGQTETYGLQFQHPIPLADLAMTALRLQPFDAPVPSGFREPLDKARAA